MFDAIRKYLFHHGGTAFGSTRPSSSRAEAQARRENTEKRGNASVGRTNPSPAGADPIALLGNAIEGLTYPSESDEPFEVVRWENPGGGDLGMVLGDHVVKGRRVKGVSVDEFFSPLKDADEAARYEALRRTIESMLDQPAVFRVGDGEVRVDVYVLGFVRSDRSIAGVHTVSVET
ncbi:MAG TPA: nuclease A inhibitor family protein [Tepidisphaeraceae bacterium]|jgi:hypothetical protein